MNPQQDIITTLREQLSEARKTANELTDEKVRMEREIKEAREIAQKYEDRYFSVRELVNVGTQKVEELERELATSVRLDDPVVSGLVEALERASGSLSEAILVLGGCGVVHPGGQSIYIQSERALSAYNARVKEVGCE